MGSLLDLQGKKSIDGQDVESGQHVVPREVDQPLEATPIKIHEYVSMDSKGETISGGATGLVQRLPSGDVIKRPWPGPRAKNCQRDMTTEANIYKRLGSHPRLVKMIDWTPDDWSLTMEYMPNGCLKDYLRAHDEISTIQRLHWIQEAAEGLQLLHSANIMHCDVEPKNFLLDAGLGLRIADFSGSSLDGSQASASARTRFEPPNFNWSCAPTVKDDLFSFGSTIYTIITGRYPFQEVPSDEVEERYKAQEFPDVTGIMCGEIISRENRATLYQSRVHPTQTHSPTATMQQNVTIAVIIIILFIIITALAYGIHRLIHAAGNNGSSSSGSDSLVDDD
ncbi:hypothetical protein V493_04496 [Pseudogymnoascus sp. VKM F-4281 (FW-2241)]|nr:hypothetical protein V493_04496 [Pseudogymnoascus sp. VKM F-4281 (FW-2241)]